MQSTNWPTEHSDALRQFLADGLSYAEIARAINEKFKTCYSRNAALGRAKRMELVRSEQPEKLPRKTASSPRKPLTYQARKRYALEFGPIMPVLERAEPMRLRCADVVPQHLSLPELKRNSCRYPYGGDEEGEAITFCGHPNHPGSSYCTAHFRLSIGPGTAQERAAEFFLVKFMEAA